MALKQITVTEASRNFSELINRVQYQGMTAILVKSGKPMVKISPVNRSKTGRELAETWRNRPALGPEEAALFEKDFEESRRALGPLISKWD